MKSLLPILTLIFGLAFMVGCSADQVVGPDTGSADLESMSKTIDCATAVIDQEPQITEETANEPRDSTAVGMSNTPNEQDTAGVETASSRTVITSIGGIRRLWE